MWDCYLGEISESYRKNWTPHTTRPDQKEPDVFDVLAGSQRIMYRLDMHAAYECFSDMIQVDWGGWAYKATKEQAILYNSRTTSPYQIPEAVIVRMEDGYVYGIIDVEMQ